MDRNLLEGLTVDEEVVDAPGVQAFEQVVGGDRPELSLEFAEGTVDLVDERGLDRVGQHSVAVRRDAVEVGFQVGKRTCGRARRRSAGGVRGLGWCHGRNSMDGSAACLRPTFEFPHVGCRIGRW